MTEQTNIQVEYLVVVSTRGGFCNSVSSFNNLLCTYDDIQITKKGLNYDNLSIGYEVDTGLINDETQRYFHVKLTSASLDSIEIFAELARLIRTILHKVGDSSPKILWDDLSLH